MYNCGDVCNGECNWEKISVIDETNKELYSEIENLIIRWNNDGTKSKISRTSKL